MQGPGVLVWSQWSSGGVYTEEAPVNILAVVSLEHHPSDKASICVCDNLAPVISIGLMIFIIKLPFI